MAKSTIARMYDDLVNAVDGIVERKYIFTGGRPNIKEADIDTMKKYIVIEIPVNIEDIAVGNHKFHLTTSGVFYLISKAKKNRTYNINALSDFVDEVTDLFPVKGEFIAAVNPIVLATGMDEYGYQIATVTFDIHTK